MADARAKEKALHSSSKSPKILRSQKIAHLPVSPVEPRSESSIPPGEAYNRATPAPRSHTPGHLSSKSQDRRHKPSELSLRQRSQSAAATSVPLVASQSFVSLPQPPAAAAAAATTAPKPSSSAATTSATQDAAAPGASASSSQNRDLQDSAAVGNTLRRPTNVRSASTIASSRPSTSTSFYRGGGSGTGSSRMSMRGVHTRFPPLVDPKTAPDVAPAPSTGMYWSRAPVSGAPHTSLRAHTTTLVGSNVYVFGGCDSRTCFNELYVLDADSFYWSVPHVVGDIPLPLRAMTCTAVGKKLVVFGGGDGPAYYNDVYVLDTVNFRWSKPRIIGDRVPSKRRAHTACLYKNGIYVFGGGDGVRALNDIWRLDVSDTTKMSWKLVSASSIPSDKPSNTTNTTTTTTSTTSTTSTTTTTTTAAAATTPTATSGLASPMTTSGKNLRPKPRGYHTANMVGSKLIIFGGSDGGECFNDVWVYDVEAQMWSSVGIPVTYRRLSHTATVIGSYMFVIGGHDGTEYCNDVLLLNLVTMSWDKRKVYGVSPSGRGYHGTVLHDSRLLVIGGFDGSEVFGDVWILELAVHAYYSQISHFSIEV